MSNTPQAPSGTYYQVSGILSQIGTSGLALTFSYSPLGVSETHNYSGAISVADQACNLLIAGTHTVTSIFLVPGPTISYRTITSGPLPFSGKMVNYDAQ